MSLMVVIPRSFEPITTRRLSLESWNLSDWRALHTIAENPEVVRYIGTGLPWTEHEVCEFVKAQIAHFDSFGYCRWKVTLRASGQLVGLCGLNAGTGGQAEIGWWISLQHWGRGLATEAARAALADAFQRVRVRRVVSTSLVANEAAVRVMEKLGMRYLKRVDPPGLVVYQIKRHWRWMRFIG